MKKLFYLFSIALILASVSCAKDDDTGFEEDDSNGNSQNTEKFKIVFYDDDKAVDSVSIENGKKTTLKKIKITHLMTDFKCWNTKKDLSGENYMPGTEYVVKSNVNLYAVWEKRDNLRDYEIYTYLGTLKDKEKVYNLEIIDLNPNFDTIRKGLLSHKEINVSVSFTKEIKKITEQAFHNCVNLKSIILPQSVTSIEEGAFNGCINLSSINIPNSLKDIGNAAFQSCISLESMTIPESVISIGLYAFQNCDYLKTLKMLGTEPPRTFNMYLPQETIIEVPASAVETYQKADGWSRYSKNISGY